MRQDELMIGNWIWFKTNKTAAVVTEIYKTLDAVPREMVALNAPPGLRYCVSMDKIEPIPLTDAILKDNGFQYHHKNFASLAPDYPFQLELVEWLNESGTGLWTVGGLIKIRFVHELQNALKICGIQKQINI